EFVAGQLIKVIKGNILEEEAVSSIIDENGEVLDRENGVVQLVKNFASQQGVISAGMKMLGAEE
ncbi:MAG TPA: hypothetical protein PK263_02540, partial [bacterium]|nr:hypothetical protein [bacterium]